jgi:hypothetical protein
MQFGNIRPFLEKLQRRLPSFAKNRTSSPIGKGYQRPQNVGLLDSLAEAWFCRRSHCDAAIFRGRYRLLHSRTLLFQINPMVDVLRVGAWGCFGNSVMQLRDVIYAAERWGVRAIEFSEGHPFFAGTNAGQITLSWGVREPTSASALQGSFFTLQGFPLSVDQSDSARIFSDYVRPLVTPQLRIPDMRVRPDDLVLHFRAGDIFSGKVHPSYGQPPLSYYLSVVEREQPARVWLVFEDGSNPCVNAAEAALRERGMDVILQSGTLDEDLRVLMSARRIVAGRGTFVHMVAHLSDCLTKIYFFEKGQLGALRRLGIRATKATDAHGEFKATVLNGNWRNEPEQHALMLSYPADRLTFS